MKRANRSESLEKAAEKQADSASFSPRKLCTADLLEYLRLLRLQRSRELTEAEAAIDPGGGRLVCSRSRRSSSDSWAWQPASSRARLKRISIRT
jgi:hypothetical protein